MTRRFAAQHFLDLGSGRAKLKRLPGIAERDISAPVKKLLAMHPNVGFAIRTNTGAGYLVPYEVMQDIIAESGGERAFRSRHGMPRWIQFGTPGCSDYLGAMQGGRTLALEVKKSKYTPSDVTVDQRIFLGLVNKCGGFGFVGSDLARINAILSGKELPEDRGGFLA